MVVGFLGKGGSGKSTTATRMVHSLHNDGCRVLAIDGDHNMDLTYNLGVSEDFPYLGSAMGALRTFAGLHDDEHYREVFIAGTEPTFSLDPIDAFTHEYSYPLASGVRVMASGPHTMAVLHGEHCSHSLSTPLKVYLPCISLADSECIVVDEKAGVDSVTTGIPTGFTIAFIVANPLEHSIRVANQIAHMLRFYGVPYEFVGNNVRSEAEQERLASQLEQPPLVVFPHNPQVQDNYAYFDEKDRARYERLRARARAEVDVRRERTREKFLRNTQYSHTMR